VSAGDSNASATPGRPAPRVSVIIAFLNPGPYLAEAIDSVVAQTLTDWELLIVDDGSSDESSLIAKQWAQRMPHQVRYLEHPGHANLGPGASRNHGMRAASGDYIAFLDADDTYLPDRLAAHVSILDALPSVDMVQSDHIYWYCWEDRKGRRQEEECRRPPLFIGDAMIHAPDGLSLLFGVPDAFTATCSVTVRRTAALELGGFEDQFRSLYEDQVFLTKVYAHKVVYALQGYHAKYRLHAEGTLSAAMANACGSQSLLNASDRKLREWQNGYLAELLETDRDVRDLLADHTRRAQGTEGALLQGLLGGCRRAAHGIVRSCLPVHAYRRVLQRRQSWSAERARRQHAVLCERRSMSKVIRHHVT